MNSITEQIRKTIDELAKNSKILENNIIDFALKSNRKKEAVEKKIKEMAGSTTNQQLIQQENFPVLWFKNIDKIVNKSPLQKSLLAVFDPAQNASLTIQGETINLSQFILIATSSTCDTGQLSNPLFSRLDCINVETAKPKEFF
ncbi:8013_t:CDS:2 [Funneliformis geosporum]|uniref:8605_t:CDS:1 n=1 Tax=Funneliformis geosporum TaxID=1117311 RepID=A0A9W4WSG5_9GLOM|nr:8013_t:CDS:2 [Funneliformis geosporum]CAI2183519.1 8605_t:CDS:2 [Funneliformis geosporum]